MFQEQVEKEKVGGNHHLWEEQQDVQDHHQYHQQQQLQHHFEGRLQQQEQEEEEEVETIQRPPDPQEQHVEGNQQQQEQYLEDKEDEAEQKQQQQQSRKEARKNVDRAWQQRRNRPNRKYCSAIKCSNNKWANPELTFFKFPRLPSLCKKWILNTRRNDILTKGSAYCFVNLRLCSNHFEESMFTTSEKNRLCSGAFPTIFSVPNPPRRVGKGRRVIIRAVPEKKPEELPPLLEIEPVLEESVSTTVVETPTKKKLRRSVEKMKKTLRIKNQAIRTLQKNLEKTKKIEMIIEAMKPFLHPDEHELVAMQMRFSVGKRRRYSSTFKSFALAIYYKSPTCYRFLQTRFKLPAKSTLNAWMSQTVFGEGFSTNLLKLLKVRVECLNKEDRVAVLMMDEVSLKKHVDYDATEDRVVGILSNGELATGALVFMVAGLKAHWRQAFAYFFVKNAVNSHHLQGLLFEALEKLEEAGLDVRAASADQGSNFSSLFAHLNCSRERPFFEYKGKKVFTFADMPHVIKSLRNCLAKNKYAFFKTKSFLFIYFCFCVTGLCLLLGSLTGAPSQPFTRKIKPQESELRQSLQMPTSNYTYSEPR